MSGKAKIPDDILKILDAVEEENRKRRTSLAQRIVEWNRARSLLTFDADTEVQMLSTCAHDFFHAVGLVERLNALADFEFLWFGTASKYGAMIFDSLNEMELRDKDYQSLFAWKESVYTIMIENVVAELNEHCQGSEDDAEWIAVLLERILTIIIEANEKMPLDDVRKLQERSRWYASPKRDIEMAFNDWVLEMEETD